MRLIDADAFKAYLDYCTKIGMGRTSAFTFKHMIDERPTIEPRKKGRWIDHVVDGYVECPFCHSATNCDDNISDLHFCFSCGARMEDEGK